MITPALASDEVTKDFVQKINRTYHGILPRTEFSIAALQRDIEASKDLRKSQKMALLGALSAVKYNIKGVHDFFNEAISVEPENPNFYYMYLRSLINLDAFDQAVSFAQQYFETFSDAGFLNIKAEAYFEAGYFHKAYKTYEHYASIVSNADPEGVAMYKEYSKAMPDEESEDYGKLKEAFASFLKKNDVFVNGGESQIARDVNGKTVEYIAYIDACSSEAARLTSDFMFDVDVSDISPNVLMKSRFQVMTLEERDAS